MNNGSTPEISLEHLRHSVAHLLAAAVLALWPDTKRAIGPAIENGFYFDFEFKHPISESDFPVIEKKMREILKTWTSFSQHLLTSEQAKKEYPNNPYKHELIDEFSEHGTKKVSFYKSGDYWDLCRGGHVENASDIDPNSFKLDRIAGAYWRGNENNKQLTRVYGLAFATAADLEAYLTIRDEAEKRDHKKLGKQLGLFTFSPLVGSGLPLYLPRGNTLRSKLLHYISALKAKRNYQFVWTPHLGKENLYVRSGHLGKYDAMLPAIETDGERFVIKPMNCPHHFEIYNSQPHSYRDLPYRIAENATVYRNEKSGELNGLLRVRSLTQDDTHHVVRHSQIGAEIDMILELTRNVYETFGFKKFRASISVRDPKHPENYFGTDELWRAAESTLVNAAERWGVEHFIGEGEAAFYGPKIDIVVEDAIGRPWQLTTVQLDYVQPENFDMTYVDETGKRVRPAVLHVAILGSVDRFLGIVIEHFGGAFPTWLSPVQLAVLPINEGVQDYAHTVSNELKRYGIDVIIPQENETLGKRIREAELQKIPYTLVVGQKEAEAGMVSVRHLTRGQEGTMKLNEFVEKIKKEIDSRSL